MGCTACQDKPKETCGKSCGKLPPVIQINSEECPILFHTVELDTSYEEDPPAIGKYKNVLVVYKADGQWVLYNSDGIPAVFGANINFNAIQGRPKYAGVEMTSDTDIPDVTLAVAAETEARVAADEALDSRIDALETDLPAEVQNRIGADTALQNQIDTLNGYASKDVVTDVSLGSATSTVDLEVTSVAIDSTDSSTTTVSLPVADATKAGVINAATFNAISQNSTLLNALLNGAVAITGLSATPTQAELTTAWVTETGLTELINRASIYDVTNEKVWTYYTNDTTWHEADASATVTVSTFTNSAEGLIKGSATGDGKVFAENDGTGSVNGWDTLAATVASDNNKLATIAQGAEVNVQSDWTETDTTSDAYIQHKPTAVSAFTNDANYVKIIASTTDIGEGATLANDTLYAVYS